MGDVIDIDTGRPLDVELIDEDEEDVNPLFTIRSAVYPAGATVTHFECGECSLVMELIDSLLQCRECETAYDITGIVTE